MTVLCNLIYVCLSNCWQLNPAQPAGCRCCLSRGPSTTVLCLPPWHCLALPCPTTAHPIASRHIITSLVNAYQSCRILKVFYLGNLNLFWKFNIHWLLTVVWLVKILPHFNTKKNNISFFSLNWEIIFYDLWCYFY